MGKLKRVLAAGLAVVCLTVFSVSTVFAATSPTTGATQKKDSYGTYTATSKTATAKTAVKNKEIDKVASKVTVKGKTYKVTEIKANAYKGATKLKKIKIYSKNLTKVSKNAFKGLKKSQVKKLKVVVTKKMSNKNYKKLVKALKKAGISAKNIKRSKIK